MKKLILASASPTRKKLLTETGLIFETVPGDYEEDMTLSLSPEKLAIHLSRGKAESVSKNHKQAIVIGADTFVVYENKILGKPHTPEKAKQMLKMLSGKGHLVVTGFTIVDTENNNIVSKVVKTKVFFRNLTDKEIDDYIATGEPLTKAGFYGVLEGGEKFVERIEGSKSNVAGLPMEELIETLTTFN